MVLGFGRRFAVKIAETFAQRLVRVGSELHASLPALLGCFDRKVLGHGFTPAYVEVSFFFR